MNYSELVKTIVFQPIEFPNGDTWQFKAEIFRQSPNAFFVEMWRLEMYRIQPTFIDDNGYADEQFYVLETWRFDVYQQFYPSEQAALQAACDSMDKEFKKG